MNKISLTSKIHPSNAAMEVSLSKSKTNPIITSLDILGSELQQRENQAKRSTSKKRVLTGVWQDQLTENLKNITTLCKKTIKGENDDLELLSQLDTRLVKLEKNLHRWSQSQNTRNEILKVKAELNAVKLYRDQLASVDASALRMRAEWQELVKGNLNGPSLSNFVNDVKHVRSLISLLDKMQNMEGENIATLRNQSEAYLNNLYDACPKFLEKLKKNLNQDIVNASKDYQQAKQLLHNGKAASPADLAKLYRNYEESLQSLQQLKQQIVEIDGQLEWLHDSLELPMPVNHPTSQMNKILEKDRGLVTILKKQRNALASLLSKVEISTVDVKQCRDMYIKRYAEVDPLGSITDPLGLQPLEQEETHVRPSLELFMQGLKISYDAIDQWKLNCAKSASGKTAFPAAEYIEMIGQIPKLIEMKRNARVLSSDAKISLHRQIDYVIKTIIDLQKRYSTKCLPVLRQELSYAIDNYKNAQQVLSDNNPRHFDQQMSEYVDYEAAAARIQHLETTLNEMISCFDSSLQLLSDSGPISSDLHKQLQEMISSDLSNSQSLLQSINLKEEISKQRLGFYKQTTILDRTGRRVANALLNMKSVAALTTLIALQNVPHAAAWSQAISDARVNLESAIPKDEMEGNYRNFLEELVSDEAQMQSSISDFWHDHEVCPIEEWHPEISQKGQALNAAVQLFLGPSNIMENSAPLSPGIQKFPLLTDTEAPLLIEAPPTVVEANQASSFLSSIMSAISSIFPKTIGVSSVTEWWNYRNRDENAKKLEEAIRLEKPLDQIKELLSKNPNLDYNIGGNRKLIHHAVEFGSVEVLELLLERHVDVHAVDDDGYTPLHYAALAANPEKIKAILKYSKDEVNQLTDRGSCPLSLSNRCEECVRLLLEAGADVHALPDDKILKGAIFTGNLKVVKMLFAKKKTDVRSISIKNAVESKNLELIRFLVTQGADPMPAFHEAAKVGNIEMVKFLLEYVEDVNAKDEHGNTALHLAAEHSHVEMVQLLIDARANPNLKGSQQKTPLVVAASKNNVAVVQKLIEAKADVNGDNSGFTPCHVAAEAGNLEVLDFLVSSNCSIGVTDERNYTPIMVAAEKGHFSCVKRLANAGASLNIRGNDGSSISDLAAKHPSSIMKFLIEQGVEVFSADNPHSSKLFKKAIEHRQEDTALLLLKQGAKISDNYPAHTFIEKGMYKIALYFLQQQPDAINSQDSSGQTPLHLACRFGQTGLARWLIAHGANPHHKDDSNITPLEWMAEGDSSMLSLLNEIGTSEIPTREETFPMRSVKLLAERGQEVMRDTIFKKADVALGISQTMIVHSKTLGRVKPLGVVKVEGSLALRNECLGYHLSNLLDRHLDAFPVGDVESFAVPTIAEIQVDGKKAIISSFAQQATTVGNLIKESLEGGSLKQDLPRDIVISTDEWMKMFVFDKISGHNDRHLNNVMTQQVVRPDGSTYTKIVLIDNDQTFSGFGHARKIAVEAYQQPISNSWKAFIGSLNPDALWESIIKKESELASSVGINDEMALIFYTRMAVLKNAAEAGWTPNQVNEFISKELNAIYNANNRYALIPPPLKDRRAALEAAISKKIHQL